MYLHPVRTAASQRSLLFRCVRAAADAVMHASRQANRHVSRQSSRQSLGESIRAHCC